ncbi:MAG: AAA family ATPase, partial [Deltaproteobacteria bacterium]|nr:AAA family ATPase [Deltaproteobacteria bacterium]
MLTELFVKNFALIDEVRMEFGPGFSVISGETGAGKSILVEALGLLVGGKAAPGLIRAFESEAIVEGIFEIDERNPMRTLLSDAGLDDPAGPASGDQLVIRRHIAGGGRNKIYINGRSAPLSQLETFGPYLIDLSGQHDQQILLHEENHRALLDGDPKIVPLLELYHRSYTSYSVLSNEVAELKQVSADRDRRLDFLKFQLKEITDAKIEDTAEEEHLLAERSRVKNADFLFELAREASEGLSEGEEAVLERVDLLISKLEKGLSRDPSLEDGLKMLAQARAPLADAGNFFASYLEKLSVEPGRLDEIEARLYLFHQLKKKYGETLGRVKEKGEEIEKSLDDLENFEDRLARKEKESALLTAELGEKASLLSEARKTAAVTLEKKIQ